MSIVLALTLATPAASEQANVAEERARAVAAALLAPDAPASIPYTSPTMPYKTFTPEHITYKVPVVQNSLAGFRKALRGCAIGDARYYAEIGIRPRTHADVSVTFKCPDDFAHAGNALFLQLTTVDGMFVKAELQVGIASTGPLAPAPPR